MKLVIIESPYAGNIEINIEYARLCLKHSIMLGEAPIASHLLYTQEGVLNDLDKNERMLGINAGLEWLRVADAHIFYVDYGWSEGMLIASERAVNKNTETIVRTILNK